nr:MAG TPA: hypothetical protein [Caudoviricetes sp.]
MFLERIELLVLVFILVRLLTLALILMHMNIKADILIRFVLGMLLRCHNKLLHKHQQGWHNHLHLTLHLHNRSSHNLLLHHLTLMIYHSSVELIKRAFNAYVVQSKKCV